MSNYSILTISLLAIHLLEITPPRKLLLFGEGLPAYEKQLRLIEAGQKDLSERDVQIDRISGDTQRIKKYNLKEGQFTVLLIGRDGGEKFRAHEPVSVKSLIDLIDAMPMRKQEMKSKKGN